MINEPTTTITDFILGLEALVLAVVLFINPQTYPSLPYWIASLACLGIAAILGGLHHGFNRPASYTGVYFCISVLMAALCLAVITDGFGGEIARGFRWPVAGLALVFFLVTRMYPTRILAFTALLAVLLVFALVLYLHLAATRALPGAGFLAAGVATLLIGAAMMLVNVKFTLIWTFDRNAVYHLMQMAGILFFFLGLGLRLS
ncbi:MAG: hypothetical protein JSU77_07235 [Fidelibacterota bacterium]|nr:MAG: hypothetical protein JSU77_07235 [Candidatus Neomarinimicrobiota bacterium]